MAQFEIFPATQWAGPCAPIKRPKEIACFSYDDNHTYQPDASGLRYYYPPALPVPLSDGFETFRKLDDSADDHLDALLATLVRNEREAGAREEADVVTWRGMMTKIMAASFSDRDGFEMNATLFEGTIFLEENHSYKVDSQARQRRQPSAPGRPSQDMMSFWGYKFETLSLLDKPWDAASRADIEGRETAMVDNHGQYVSVARTGIGATSLILGGEVDAVWDSKPATGPINWVELKTAAEPRSDRDMLAFERKLLKFWAQSFLLGVPRIVVGFRDAGGVLRRLEELHTAGIPGSVKRRGKGSWDGNVCINFAGAWLSWLKTVVTGEGVWRIRRRERAAVVEVFRVEETGHGDILSEEFLSWRRELAAKGTLISETQLDEGSGHEVAS